VSSILLKTYLRRREMKRTIFTLLVLFAFSISAYAEMGMMKGQSGGQMIGKGQQMPMMQMMQMMMDMMKMQEKMMMGVKPAEKKQMMKDMASMREKMQKMMSMHMGMMTGANDAQARLKCAEEWLKKAIDLHELHMKDPKTATEASQMEMMEQMKKAYSCITGTGTEMSGTQPEESAGGEKKKDAHSH
jgi:hypothetical protein